MAENYRTASRLDTQDVVAFRKTDIKGSDRLRNIVRWRQQEVDHLGHEICLVEVSQWAYDAGGSRVAAESSSCLPTCLSEYPTIRNIPKSSAEKHCLLPM
jgi:hypothetical protein